MNQITRTSEDGAVQSDKLGRLPMIPCSVIINMLR